MDCHLYFACEYLLAALGSHSFSYLLKSERCRKRCGAKGEKRCRLKFAPKWVAIVAGVVAGDDLHKLNDVPSRSGPALISCRYVCFV
jgi:hypothetical protein